MGLETCGQFSQHFNVKLEPIRKVNKACVKSYKGLSNPSICYIQVSVPVVHIANCKRYSRHSTFRIGSYAVELNNQ